MQKDTDINQGREVLIEALRSYAVRYPEEIETTKRFLDFVLGTPQCFEREHLEGHVTGSAWLIDPTNTMVLLNHHRKLDKWLQFGGHADGDANILRVALAETREESGIEDVTVLQQDIFDVDIHRIPERIGTPEHFHFDVRFLLQANSMQHSVSDESHALRWVPFECIADFTTEPSMIRMANKWKRFRDQS